MPELPLEVIEQLAKKAGIATDAGHDIASAVRKALSDEAAVSLTTPQATAEVLRHPTAFIDPTARIAEGVPIGAHATIGEGVVVSTGAVVNPGVRIGPKAIICEQVVLGPDVIVGKHASIHPGVVIGARSIIG